MPTASTSTPNARTVLVRRQGEDRDILHPASGARVIIMGTRIRTEMMLAQVSGRARPNELTVLVNVLRSTLIAYAAGDLPPGALRQGVRLHPPE